MALQPYELGQVVYSKCGRDKGLVFVVVAVEGDYVYLADGALRTLDKPKKKKLKHIQVTKNVSGDMNDKLSNQKYLLDADVRKALASFKN